MDATKQLGICKEQIKIERLARHNFQKKWAKLADERLNRIYNQNEVNKELKEILRTRELCPYEYTGEGDSYFLSPHMYDALLAKCRCGRKRSEMHILKCLQKVENTKKTITTPTTTTNDDSTNNTIPKAESKLSVHDKSIPKTSNSLIGWQKRTPYYKQWENSMKHISPIATMPEPRLTATAYPVLHIA